MPDVLGSIQPMIFLRKMRGISEMLLSVQTIRTCKKVFTKQQFISIDFLRSLALMRYLEEVQLWNFLN